MFEEIDDPDDPPVARTARAPRRTATPRPMKKKPSPAPKPNPRAKPKAKPRAEAKPARRKARPARRPAPVVPADDWLTDDGLLDDIDDGPPPSTPRRAKSKPGSRRRRRKRRRPSRDWQAAAGGGIYAGIALLLVGSAVFTLIHELGAGTGPDVVDFVRWAIAASILVKLWQGSTAARLVWSGLLLLAAALIGSDFFIAGGVEPGPGGGARILAIRRATAIAFAVSAVALVGLMYTPCFTAFLARRRGER